MRNRVTKLVAVSLMICLTLAMTTIFASATDYTYTLQIGGKNVQAVYDSEEILAAGTEISCEADVLEVVYYEEYFETETVWKTETYNNAGTPITTSLLDTPAPVPGYKDNVWQIVGISWDKAADTGTTTETVWFARDAVEYNVAYYDCSEFICKETISLDTAENYFNGYSEKQGYALKGWDIDSAGKNVVYKPDQLLTSEVLLNIPGTLNLYAVWEKAPVAPPAAPSTPTDESPATGDNTPIAVALVLMILSAISIVAVTRKSL